MRKSFIWKSSKICWILLVTITNWTIRLIKCQKINFLSCSGKEPLPLRVPLHNVPERRKNEPNNGERADIGNQSNWITFDRCVRSWPAALVVFIKMAFARCPTFEGGRANQSTAESINRRINQWTRASFIGFSRPAFLHRRVAIHHQVIELVRKSMRLVFSMMKRLERKYIILNLYFVGSSVKPGVVSLSLNDHLFNS